MKGHKSITARLWQPFIPIKTILKQYKFALYFVSQKLYTYNTYFYKKITMSKRNNEREN